ncbi:hypothetical protein PGT21_025563 [Puccinia graminis f. sp. tritici]|uniref:Uncharacterized protein n=1 Tax=Puccinia graminis f. sp. tritici TaxID=56615 RepID=A0A5B0P3G3_PUCGR|nr:hypothetical protein PGT21_025563 [Puccinia graminis f. sp. tritici]
MQANPQACLCCGPHPNRAAGPITFLDDSELVNRRFGARLYVRPPPCDRFLEAIVLLSSSSDSPAPIAPCCPFAVVAAASNNRSSLLASPTKLSQPIPPKDPTFFNLSTPTSPSG